MGLQADGEDGAAAVTPEAPAALSSTPEVEMYAYLLVLMFLVDHKQYDQVGRGSSGRQSQ